MTGFIVDPSQLKDHSAQVHQIAKNVDLAGDAASQEGIGGVDAYGLLCSPILIPALHLFFADAQSLVKSVGDFGDAMAEGLDSTGQVYDSVDQDIHGSLTKLHSDLIS